MDAITKLVSQRPVVNSLVEDAAIQKCVKKHKALPRVVKKSVMTLDHSTYSCSDGFE